MPLPITYNSVVDIASGTTATGDSISVNVSDVDVYTINLQINDQGLNFDLTGVTVQLTLNGTIIITPTVVDASTGKLSIALSDLSSYQAGTVYNSVMTLTQGSLVRNIRGIVVSCFDL